MITAEMNEELAARKRETRRKALKCVGALLVLGVVAALAVFFVWQSSQPTEEDLASIGFYNRLNWGEEGSDSSLLVVQENKLFGYANRNGEVVIPCQYEAAYPFHEGLAAVKKKNRWGYVDQTGKTVISFRFYEALGFHDGRAFVSHRARYVDLIDEDKHVSKNALVLAAYALIDQKGKIISDFGYYESIGYRHGMYAAQANKFDAYFDTNGNLLLKKDREATHVFPIKDSNGDGRYDNYHLHFNDGLAVVFFINNDGHGAYIMDRQGNHAIGDFLDARDFSEGLAAVQIGDPKSNTAEAPWGYIDTKGRGMTKALYAEAFSFGEGLAVVKILDGQWAVIDTESRETAIQEPLVWAEAFREGMCAVRVSKSNKMGFMDTAGKLVVPCQYDKVSNFNDGIAEVMIDEKIGYIDKSGKYVWEPK